MEKPPLHRAVLLGVRLGEKEVIELLIAKGADLNTQDALGGTPLDEAILFEKKEIVDLLRKNGATEQFVAFAVSNSLLSFNYMED